ncbi:MAG: hypothetical protein AAFU85_26025 [Planctomycetota bacterium]
MIIISRRMGQLGNRLFLFSYLIAAARHYGVKLLNPCFAEYAHLFPSTRHDLWCRYDRHLKWQHGADRSQQPSRSRRMALMNVFQTGTRVLDLTRMRRIPFNVIRLRREESCDLEGERFCRAILSGRPVLLQGWWFRSRRLLDHHSPAIREFFEIDAVDQTAIDATISRARRDIDVLVGVHIRRGDYARFLGGKYYYDFADYARWMNEVREQLPGKRVGFLVCSNEPVHSNDFPGLRICSGPGTPLQDMYSLAETDWMMGPPSTFTGWASFYGERPLVSIESSDVSVVAPPVKAHLASERNRITDDLLSVASFRSA